MQRAIFLTVFLAMVIACPFSFSAEEGFVSLFNGKDLTGWSQKGGDAKYSVEDGCIVGVVNDERRNSFMCSEKEYENFIFKVEFKFDRNFNSGIQFRSQSRPDGNREDVYGYQCEMEPAGMTGAVYDESRRNRWLNIVTREFDEKTKKSFKQGDWNELEIQCVGPSVRTWLNGQPISDFFDTMSDRGFFGLQVHAASKENPGQVRWRNIWVKELPATPWKPFFKDKQFVNLEVKPAGKWEFLDDDTVYATSTPAEKRDGMVISKEEYKDFAVRISFKRGEGNSGLYFRAVEIDAPHWVCGFQCEIEEGHVSGGLWEVGGGPSKGRGWVFSPPEENVKNYKANDWNDICAVAVGDRIVTNLNGRQVVDKIDPDCLKEGKTAIQLHGGSQMEYWFKKYEIMPLNKEMVNLITR
ncbi:MAG: DUF1080 domain-containing protein [Planctomycetaceae bacterium]|nr:DUF1080 domain-containing protein [Planctomycetaceae bacterium]